MAEETETTELHTSIYVHLSGLGSASRQFSSFTQIFHSYENRAELRSIFYNRQKITF